MGGTLRRNFTINLPTPVSGIRPLIAHSLPSKTQCGARVGRFGDDKLRRILASARIVI